MAPAFVLGLDTSAYTTSIALLDEEGRLVHEARRRLPVAPGERGLRQSEALFRHLLVLPELLEEASARLTGGRAGEEALPLLAVAASTAPRPRPESYLPVFRAGERMGRALAAVAGVPFFPLSHQEGHLLAVWYEKQQEETGRQGFAVGAGEVAGEKDGDFLLLHVSGGTTELLHVQPDRRGQTVSGFTLEELGGSVDLKAGQFVDRVAVALGLPFPGGPALERLAAAAPSVKLEGHPRLPVGGRGLRVSFSGPATQAERWVKRGVPAAVVAQAVQECLVETLLQLVAAGWEILPQRTLFVVGGVAANGVLRQRLVEEASRRGAVVHFASPERSTDNAVGVAYGGWRAWKEREKARWARQYDE